MKPLGERKKAVILGAPGFIGVNLARVLAMRNYDLALTRREIPPDSDWANIQPRASLLLPRQIQLPREAT